MAKIKSSLNEMRFSDLLERCTAFFGEKINVYSDESLQELVSQYIKEQDQELDLFIDILSEEDRNKLSNAISKMIKNNSTVECLNICEGIKEIMIRSYKPVIQDEINRAKETEAYIDHMRKNMPYF